jgi:hypothetical protein
MLASIDDIVFDPEPHTYVRSGRRYMSVTEAIRVAGIGDDFSGIPSHVLAYAQARGRAVHLACQHINNGGVDMDSIDQRIWGYVEAYQLFIDQCHTRPIAAEKILFTDDLMGRGKEGEGISVAGTVDLVTFVNGSLSVLDIKTGQNKGRGAPRQTAGYARLWNLRNPTRRIMKRFGLYLGPDGRYQLVPHEDPTDIYAFCDAARYTQEKLRMEQWRNL